MTSPSSQPVLLITRAVILLIMGLIAVAATILVATAAILPFYWTEVAQQIAVEKPGLDAAALYPWLYVVFALGLVALLLILTIMRKLLAIVGSVALGDPFAMANAVRLKAIGWLMVALQLIGIPLSLAAGEAADLFGRNNVGFDFSLNAVLSILLVFVLAGIFEQGAAMGDELEGTV
ncbi:DUF2975 domain-containing protein [Sphingopyxis sp. L1A2A]|uniref:DUF2975 domain-containing protein n=1 Tax=Sphingopyxis sp. L1A2A TaxID=2502247 RepID=UPI0010F7D0BD|nr:DUF2975 domain-containing protein [Sphingopyxis sp. L1A2A]